MSLSMKLKNNKFGIVQGRLIQAPPGCLQWFPQQHWEKEFFLASALGLDYIELIAETEHNENNPIWSDDGIKLIKELIRSNRLEFHSFCNDYIINHSLIQEKGVIDQSIKLLVQGGKIGLKKLILPFFEASEINENNYKDYKNNLVHIAEEAQKLDILVCLESILDGPQLMQLLEYVNHPNIKVVFDTGNRIAFGHDIYDDMLLLENQIKHIHIKDKDSKNNNVLLGTGLVNFKKVSESLQKLEYSDQLTFETDRGALPLETAKYNLNFINFFLKNSRIESE